MLLSQPTKPQQRRLRQQTAMLEPTLAVKQETLYPRQQHTYTQPRWPDEGIKPQSVLIGLRGQHCVICDTLYENKGKRFSAIFHECPNWECQFGTKVPKIIEKSVQKALNRHIPPPMLKRKGSDWGCEYTPPI